MWGFLITVAIIQGIICFALASRKGRDKGIAFVMGMLFGLFSILSLINTEPSTKIPHIHTQNG